MLLDYSCIIGITTLTCSLLSLVGSILVLLSYLVARTRAASKTAQLILHLAASDFFWFFAACLISACWIFNNGQVPMFICALCTPVITFTRLASLLWTCIISFNVWMSVEKRHWLIKQKSQQQNTFGSAWTVQRWKYYLVIFIIASPATVLTIIKQYSSDIAVGCSAGYEPLGVWYEVLFPEVLPIVLGFLFTVYVYLKVRGRISRSAYPQSVRKRRKRIMYHYIIVCILSWVPTVVSYFVEIAGHHSAVLEIISRACLYSSGLMNFLVFGLQDPHLKRSFVVVMYHMGLADCLMLMPEYYDSRESGAYSKDHIRGYSLLKASDVEKSVMFEEATITRSADIAKDKRSVYRNRKLSREDKLALYAERPDLDLRNQMQQKQQQPQQDEDEEEQKEPPPPQEPPRQPRVQCSVGFSGSLFSGGTEETTDELSRPLLLDGANEAAAVGGSPHLAGSRRVGVPIVDLESNGAEADGSCGSDIIPLTVNPMHGRRFESINISHTNKEVLSPDSSFNMDNDAAAADSPAHIWISNELSFAARNQQAPAAIAPHATAAQETTRTWRDAQREDDSDASSDDENDEEDLELSRPIWSASTS